MAGRLAAAAAARIVKAQADVAIGAAVTAAFRSSSVPSVKKEASRLIQELNALCKPDSQLGDERMFHNIWGGEAKSEEATVPFNDWHAFRDEARLKALKNEKYTIDGKLIK